MNDYQKVQMTMAAYLEVDKEGKEKLKNGEGIKLSEIDQYLSKKDQWVFGDGLYNKNLNKMVVKTIIGSDESMYATISILAQRINDAGMGDLVIKAIESDSKTSFQAIALEDQEKNILISYRGSNFNWTKGCISEWTNANFLEFFSPELSNQIEKAKNFFDKNKSKDGKTAVYGASLGGNLTSHVFLERESEISAAFVFNANPIDQELINTVEKQKAFQSNRYTFCSIAGDIISRLKNTVLYENRIMYVENNHIGKPNVIAAHMVESISVDSKGNLIKTNKKSAEKECSAFTNKTINFIHATKEWLNNHEKTSAAIVQTFKGHVPNNVKAVIAEWFQDKDKQKEQNNE